MTVTDSSKNAKLTPMTNASGKRKAGTAVPVHFNPESLALTIRNQTEKGGKREAKAGRRSSSCRPRK